jgi:hypothetical protein
MKDASTSASSAAPPPMAMTVRKPACVETCAPWKPTVIWASTTPATALETEVPSDRMRELRLFAAAVSETGTAPVTSAGIAP